VTQRAVPIALLAAAGFASGSGMRMVDPLLPMIGTDFGVPTASVAVVLAAFLITYGGGQLATGPAGDRFGKLRVAALALMAFGSCTVLAEFAGDVTQLAVLRALGGLCAGAVIPLLMAHIGDTVPYQDRQAALGRFLTGNVVAQFVAGPASGLIGEAFGWRASFLAFGCSTAAVGLVLALRLGSAMWADGGGPRGAGPFAGFARIFATRPGRLLMLAAFLDGALLFGGAFPFVAAYLIEGHGLNAAQAGLVVAGFGLGALAYTRGARRLVARFGETRLLLGGGLGLALVLWVIAAAPGWWAVLGAQILCGLFFYSFHGVLQARATEALPDARGTAVACFAMCLFMGQTMGNLLFAAIMATAGYGAAFAAAGAGMVGLAVWSARLPRG
jgi:predicted MFS family arabinose efflux permease